MVELNKFDIPEDVRVDIPENIQISVTDTAYKFIPVRVTQCNSNEHKYFINNMRCWEVLDLFKNIIEQVELKEINKINEGRVFDRSDEQLYFLRLVNKSDLKDMSAFMTGGFITRTKLLDTTVIESTSIPTIKRLLDLNFMEFISMYQIIQSWIKDEDKDKTLSDACPKYFHWRGV